MVIQMMITMELKMGRGNQSRRWDTAAAHGRGESADGDGDDIAGDDGHDMYCDIDVEVGYAERHHLHHFRHSSPLSSTIDHGRITVESETSTSTSSPSSQLSPSYE